MKRGWWFGKFLVMGLAALGIMGGITMLLWNWLVPVLFHGPEVTFWQALGLLALSKILFWSFGKGGQWRHRPGPWGKHWSQKWEQMSPEERERLRSKMWEKWCAPRETTAARPEQPANG